MDHNTNILQMQRTHRGREVSPYKVEDSRERDRRIKRNVERIKASKPLRVWTTADVRPVLLTPDKVQELFEIFSKHARRFVDEYRSVPKLQEIFMARDSMFWELPGKGLFYLTDIRPSNMAFCHLILYDKESYINHELIRQMIREVMKHLELRRLNAWIPADNRVAMLLARVLGFKREGLLRRWAKKDGHWISMVMFGLLREEIDYG